MKAFEISWRYADESTIHASVQWARNAADAVDLFGLGAIEVLVSVVAA